ncbi:hypothetical protein CGLO_08515 [Colletotrichum gloeosporioides Cg-14]|uniref:Uncharacterized protein n=1 Tax=Colletotrichum gloeosporioides (strain Cg-14) TaxID=1237896 RepID=T0KFZ6_COLGC|nr:hypothetical protein CGLO_08515 [Colletotrichum gloeosporioides Cg-14]
MSQSSEYSHEATVKAITSFYEFMKRMHSEEAVLLQYPPPTGWPQITHESFAGLDKTKAVIELLRHIPYFVIEPCILESTRPICYIDRQYCEEIKRWPALEPPELDNEEGRLPGYIIGLASAREEQVGYTLLLDTKRGVVILWKNDGNLPRWTQTSDADPYDVDADPYGPQGWKCMPTYRIETFFEFCKEQYRLMNWMPDMQDLTRGAVVQLNDPEHVSEGALRRRQIMTDAGWPGIDGDGTGWDKETAEREMDEHADDIAC